VMTEAMVAGKTVTEFRACDLSDALKSAWEEIKQLAGLSRKVPCPAEDRLSSIKYHNCNL